MGETIYIQRRVFQGEFIQGGVGGLFLDVVKEQTAPGLFRLPPHLNLWLKFYCKQNY